MKGAIQQRFDNCETFNELPRRALPYGLLDRQPDQNSFRVIKPRNTLVVYTNITNIKNLTIQKASYYFHHWKLLVVVGINLPKKDFLGTKADGLAMCFPSSRQIYILDRLLAWTIDCFLSSLCSLCTLSSFSHNGRSQRENSLIREKIDSYKASGEPLLLNMMLFVKASCTS